jgi:hypothetical protein
VVVGPACQLSSPSFFSPLYSLLRLPAAIPVPPVATVPLGDGGARQASRSSQRRISACSLSDTAPYLSSAPSVVIVLPPPPSRCALLASRRHPASDGSWPSQLPPLPPPLACTRCANFIPRARVLTSSCRASFYDERTNVPAPPPPAGLPQSSADRRASSMRGPLHQVHRWTHLFPARPPRKLRGRAICR